MYPRFTFQSFTRKMTDDAQLEETDERSTQCVCALWQGVRDKHIPFIFI